MQEGQFIMTDPQQVNIHVYRWLPDNGTPPKGIVQIAHGMTEKACRYKRFAQALTQEGYIVYANDHRGHGKTAGHPDELGYVGKDGFEWMVKNMAQLNEHIRREHPGLPLFLFTHSMGSFLGQKYMYTYPDSIDGIILSGSDGKRGIELSFGIWAAGLLTRVRGDRHRSRWIDSMAFGSFNRKFKPSRTPLDWLSRDEAEVDRYIADPECGMVCTIGFYYDFFRLLQEIHRPDRMSRIPKSLPILVISGEDDPVGHHGKGIMQLLAMYRDLQLTEVQSKLYPGARHELLNETIRDEVTGDIIQWLNQRLEYSSSS